MSCEHLTQSRPFAVGPREARTCLECGAAVSSPHFADADPSPSVGGLGFVEFSFDGVRFGGPARVSFGGGL